MLYNYDDSNEDSIFNYAKKLENKTFRDIKNEYDSQYKVNQETVHYTLNEKAKGQLGGFLEQFYFGYKPNSDQTTDFDKVGIELKQTPLNLLRNGKYAAGERLSITNISYKEPVNDFFYESHLYNKIKKILLVQYLRDKTIERLDYEIKFVTLFTPSNHDLKIIIDDYNTINNKIKAGLAHEISEGDTFYLGACTKGSNAINSIKPQFYGDNIPARKRNFCFKNSYMNYVLNNYVLNNRESSESIINNLDLTEDTPFDDAVIEKINQYKDMTDIDIALKLGKDYKGNKALWYSLSLGMLGIKSNRALEFVKSNVIVKTIRVESDGNIIEHISLKQFKFNDFIKEDWEYSELYNYFIETRFLFVIFKNIDGKYHLDRTFFWNMPYDDLNNIAYSGWKNIQDTVKNGVVFQVGKTVKNNLPKSKDNPIIHIRPHSNKSAYKLNSGFEKGDLRDANQLPNGEWMTTQSFWINSKYMKKIINQ